MKSLLRSVVLALTRVFGSRLVDCETGEELGKAILLPWGGKIHVIGLERSVRLAFLPQTRLTYWKQEIGFTVHPPPDFPNETGEMADDS